MRTWQSAVKVAAAGVLAVATSAGSCSESLERSERNLNEAQRGLRDLERSVEPNPEINRQVNGLSLGMSKDEVVAQMGSPDDRQVSHTEYGTSEFLYYGQWQLSFTDGVLDGKSRY